MDAAAQRLKEKLSEKANFLDELFKQLGDNLTMNIKQGRLLNEVNRSYKYTQMPVETLAGSYTMGADGFVEFHPAEGAAIQWVLQALYEACGRIKGASKKGENDHEEVYVRIADHGVGADCCDGFCRYAQQDDCEYDPRGEEFCGRSGRSGFRDRGC